MFRYISGVKRVVFFSHDATRTGAPIQLFHIAGWFQKPGYQIVCHLVFDRGELRKEFRAAFKSGAIFTGSASVSSTRSRLKAWVRWRQLVPLNPDLIFVNSVASVRPLLPLLPNGVPVIFRMPEMAETLPNYASRQELRAFLDRCTAVIVPSEPAAIDLEAYAGKISPEIHILGGFCPPVPALSASKPLIFSEKIKTVVASAGLPGWRKGIDLFLQTARMVCRETREIGFLWIGADRSSPAVQGYEAEVRRLGLEEQVVFLDPVPNIQPYLSGNVVFGLFSREDPLPIVALEAGNAGCPVLCFEGTGGVPTLLSALDPAAVIPYGNIEQFAKSILDWHREPETRNKSAETWSGYVRKHHAYEAVMSRIEKLVETIIK